MATQENTNVAANEWVRESLKRCGYTQKDLARAWGVSGPSVTRFISGEESRDPPLSRAAILASMLGISINDLAKGLGLLGRRIEPIVAPETGLPAVGTVRMSPIPDASDDRVRVVIVQDMRRAQALQMMAVPTGLE